MTITDKERDRVARIAAGGVGPMPDGPIVETFDPLAIAEALEQQAIRAKIVYDVPKVDLRMDADDALKLAKLLRGG